MNIHVDIMKKINNLHLSTKSKKNFNISPKETQLNLKILTSTLMVKATDELILVTWIYSVPPDRLFTQ